MPGWKGYVHLVSTTYVFLKEADCRLDFDIWKEIIFNKMKYVFMFQKKSMITCLGVDVWCAGGQVSG